MVQGERLYSSAEVCVFAGITARQLQWWVDKGVIRAVRKFPLRKFTEPEMRRALVIAQFRRKGISLSAIRRLRFNTLSPYIVTDGKTLIQTFDPNEVIEWVGSQRRGCYLVYTNGPARGKLKARSSS